MTKCYYCQRSQYRDSSICAFDDSVEVLSDNRNCQTLIKMRDIMLRLGNSKSYNDKHYCFMLFKDKVYLFSFRYNIIILAIVINNHKVSKLKFADATKFIRELGE